MKNIKTKQTKSGHSVSIMVAKGKGEYFANGKKYWISYGDGNPRNATVRSNSLSYIQKKFEEIS